MTSYQIQGPKVCAVSGRELRTGEAFYSALLDEAGQFLRKDFAADSWKEPPPGSIAWWSGRIPESGKVAKPTINDSLLVDCFEHLSATGDPARQNFRYVVALLLMRRKRYKFEDAKKQEGRETLILRDIKSGVIHEVLDPQLSDEEMDTVRDEVFRVLGWE
jgi:hypothetical protein